MYVVQTESQTLKYFISEIFKVLVQTLVT